MSELDMLIQLLARLPGLGPRSARRAALYLLKRREQVMLFQKAYPEVKLDAQGFNSRDFWPRLSKEREAGQYLWDLRVGGADTNVYNFKRAGNMTHLHDPDKD